MKAGWSRKALCVFGLVLWVSLATPALAAQSGTPSVLSRVQTVDDPELADLLRVALEGFHRFYSSDPVKEAELVQAVTESYAKIKLLDRQVEETAEKLKGAKLPWELQHEITLAKAELESKRLIELAHLRQVMGIIPDYPLGRKSVWSLKTWLELGALGERVYVVELVPPFAAREEQIAHKPVGLMSPEQAVAYVGKCLQTNGALPLRVDILPHGSTVLSERLKQEIIDLVKKGGNEMQAEVHADFPVPQGPRDFLISLTRQGGMALSDTQLGRWSVISQNSLELKSLEERAGRFLARPENVPARFRIDNDQPSGEGIPQVRDVIETVAKRLGLTEYVEVTVRDNSQR